MNLGRLPLGYKLAITLFLLNVLLVLMFGQMQVRYAVEWKDGEPGVTPADLRLFFSGDPKGNRLQRMVDGPMHRKFATPEEKETVDDWIAEGAPRETFDSEVLPILEARCIRCHGPAGDKAESPLTTYEEVSEYTEITDTGVSYPRLAELSYQHTLAMSCFVALVVGLFYLTRYRGAWKQILMGLPLLTVFTNVLSWWSAKQSEAFVALIVISVLVMAVSILLMVLMTLVDIWILPEKDQRKRRLQDGPLA